MTGWVKTCVKCGVERELTEFRFHHSNNHRYGRGNSCRLCRNALAQEIDSLRRIGLKTPPNPLLWSEERSNRLLALFDQGLSRPQIAKELAISKNAVIGKLYRLGLSNGVPETTTMQRLDALHIRMDAALAESAAIPRRMPMSKAAWSELVKRQWTTAYRIAQ